MPDTPIPLSGILPIRVEGQKAQPAWIQEMMKQHLSDGVGASQKLRFQCRIAQDVNDSIAAALQPPFVPNPKARAQFGRNEKGLPYLTVGITNTESAVNIKIRWEGDAIPKKMVDVAIKHDEGKAVRTATIDLDLAKAVAYVLGEKKDKRRTNHRTRLDGTPIPTAKKRYARMCAADAVRFGTES